MSNKIVVTDSSGNEILNAEDRRIAQDMLRAATVNGENIEREAIVKLLGTMASTYTANGRRLSDEQAREDSFVLAATIEDVIIPKIQERAGKKYDA